MIVAIISLILVLANLYSKNNRLLLGILFLWMWIIFTFTGKIADEPVYMSRYNHPELWVGNSELLFSGVISVCRKLGLGFVGFRGVVGFLQLSLVFTTICKLAKYPNLVACLYMLYPFPLNVAQIRNALAMSVFIFAIRYLVEDDEEQGEKIKITLNDCKYLCLILVASLIHSASLIWVILLLVKKVDVKKTVIITILFNAFILFIFNPKSINAILELFGASGRMMAYFSDSYQMSTWRHMGMTLIQVTFTAGCLIFLCLYILNKKKKYVNQDGVKLALKCNVIILVIYGLIYRFTSEVYRMQEGMTLLSLIMISNSFKTEKLRKNSVSESNIRAILVLLCFIIGIMVLSIGIYLVPTILEPILNENILINYIFQ